LIIFFSSPKPTNFNGVLKHQIAVANLQKIFVLRNGDIVRGSRDSDIQIYDSNTGQIKMTLNTSYNSSTVFGQLSNGILVVGYRASRVITLWDLQSTNQPTLKRTFQIDESLYSLTVLKNNDLAIGQSGFNTDIVIRDSQIGHIKTTLQGHTDFVNQILELDNGYLISCSDDRTVKIWNPNSNTTPLKSFTFQTAVNSIAAFKNNNLACGLNERTIQIISLDTGNLVRTLSGHTDSICWRKCLLVLDNGDLLSASIDKTIRVWNTVNGNNYLTATQHKNPIYEFSFLPNGNLVSVSNSEMFIWS
jgi:WD40 repeat protein